MLSLVIGPTIEPLTVAEAKRQLLLNETAGEPAPTAPDVALSSPAVAGNCDNGAWRIGYTFVTADGETELGALSAPDVIVDKTVNGRLAVTNIAIGGPNVTARNTYAVGPGETTARYVGQIADNTTTTETINIAVSALGVTAPTTNTTEDPDIIAKIQAVRERAEGATNRALIGPQTWDLLLDGFPAEGYIEIPKPPLVSVTYVKYLDTGGTLRTATANVDYIVQAPTGLKAGCGRVALPFAGVWPVTLQQMGAVTVRFVCGYGTNNRASVPALIREGMKLDLGTLFGNRENVVVGTIAMEIPGWARSIYWSYRAHPQQRLKAGIRL